MEIGRKSPSKTHLKCTYSFNRLSKYIPYLILYLNHASLKFLWMTAEKLSSVDCKVQISFVSKRSAKFKRMKCKWGILIPFWQKAKLTLDHSCILQFYNFTNSQRITKSPRYFNTLYRNTFTNLQFIYY